jgi:hypothetical protein
MRCSCCPAGVVRLPFRLWGESPEGRVTGCVLLISFISVVPGVTSVLGMIINAHRWIS